VRTTTKALLAAAVLAWVVAALSRRGGDVPGLVQAGLLGLAIGLMVQALTLLWEDRRRSEDT
jgi:hypothetical protein